MGAVNRFYYAAFYAARALLAVRELDSSRHSGVISLFQKHFVKPGLVSADTAKALPRAFEKRQKSDYGDFSTVTPKEAKSIRDETKGFLEECEQLLNRLTTEGKLTYAFFQTSVETFCLRAESLEGSDNLPDPDVLAQEIV